MNLKNSLPMVVLGMVIMVLIASKGRRNLEQENGRMKTKVLQLEKDVVQAEKTAVLYDGGLMIFPKDTTSITLKGFEGTIIWYTSPNFQNLFEKSPADFHPIGQSIEIQKGNQTLVIPARAHALMRNYTRSGTYNMEANGFSSF